MTLSTQEQVKCPQCGHQQEVLVWITVNVTLNPELREALFKGTLFTFACNSCGHTADCEYPLLYHDMGTEVLIWYIPPGREGEFDARSLGSVMRQGMSPSYRLRLVRSRNALIEKIMVFDAGLDDAVVEVLKLYAVFTLPEQDREQFEVRFERIAETEGKTMVVLTLVHPSMPKAMSMPWSRYEEFAERHASSLLPTDDEKDTFLEVDAAYILLRKSPAQ